MVRSDGMKKKKMTGSKLFDFCNIIIMILVILVTAYPFLYVILASFSDPTALATHSGLLLTPLEPMTTKAYEMVLGMPSILSGYKNTIIVLVLGVSTNMVMTILGAFFLSLKGPMHKNLVSFMVIFTMYFSGGLIPSYLNVKDLGLLNSLWSLILPGAIGTTNMIILRTAFQNIPDSLTEAAQLDGANYLQILFQVFLPLTKATLAVLVLYYGVSHWNAWFNASIYLMDTTKYPLQLVMRQLLDSLTSTIGGVDDAVQYIELIKYALIIVSTVPILVLYPFLQKYFTKGVMIGALKG